MHLPPSQYHHFHSPAHFRCTPRIRIPGHVGRFHLARLIPELIWTNERVALLGRWQHGFMGIVAVAATAFVGRIRLLREPELRTNFLSDMAESWPYLSGKAQTHALAQPSTSAYGTGRFGPVPVKGEDKATPTRGLHVKRYEPPLVFQAADEVGWFQVGSGFVLVFEAPEDWKLDDHATPGTFHRLASRISAR
jgi:phosphatidylserine decarboxylase